MKFLSAILVSALVSFGAHADESYVGIGIVTEKNSEKFFKVTGLVENGPAHKAGVKLNDVVVAVDAKSVKGLSSDDFSKLIRGEAGTKVVLSVKNKVNTTPFDIQVVRENITIACYMEGNVSLSLSGDANSGFLSGYVGKEFVTFNVFSGRASGSYKGSFLYLDVNDDAFGNISVSGWVKNGYVNWRGFGAFINSYQPCIY